MVRTHRPDDWSSSGLRTRYRPKSRISQGLISVGPWVDVVLLVILFLFMDRRIVLQPGVRVNIPSAPFVDGSRIGLVAVVLSVRGADAGAPESIVFFDDERFVLSDANQTRALEHAFAQGGRSHPEADLVIQADEDVPHGTVIGIMNMARRVGLDRVNLAARPQE